MKEFFLVLDCGVYLGSEFRVVAGHHRSPTKNSPSCSVPWTCSLVDAGGIPPAPQPMINQSAVFFCRSLRYWYLHLLNLTVHSPTRHPTNMPHTPTPSHSLYTTNHLFRTPWTDYSNNQAVSTRFPRVCTEGINGNQVRSGHTSVLSWDHEA